MSPPPACPRSGVDDRFVRNSTILRAAKKTSLECLTRGSRSLRPRSAN